MNSRFAILLDGGFVTKRLSVLLGRFPEPEDILGVCKRISAHHRLEGRELLRIYFYDAAPATDTVRNPINGTELALGKTKIHARSESFFDRLEMEPDVALRMGETFCHGWELGKNALKSISKSPRQIEANDLVPKITQKGVDLRIGLDIARISLRQSAGIIVVVTGDSDMIPAFKFARREGVRVYLETLNGGVRRDLKAHADLVLDTWQPANVASDDAPRQQS